MAVSIFEPIFDGSVLQDSVEATLRTWMRTYLDEIQDQRDSPDQVPNPTMYVNRNTFTTFPDDVVPMVVIISPGAADPPTADGEGRYSGWWGLGIGVIAAANTEENSDRIAKTYGAAIRTILLQKQGLDEAWEYGGIELVDEDYTDVPDPEQERTMRAARLVFRVWVQNVSNKFAGPAAPAEPDPDMPGSEWPTVTEADVVVNVVEEVNP